MKFRILILTGLLLLISFQLYSYNYERIDSTVTGVYKIIHFQEKSVPWDLFVMEIDLTQDGMKLKTGLANNKVAYIDAGGNNFTQKETLSSMINRRKTSGENVIAGINADFFDMTQGRQFNITATGGRIASTGITSMPHSALYTDENGTPYIHLIDMQHTMSIPGKGERAINSVNNIRRADHLVLYNHFTGDNNSFANQWGVELLLKPLDDVYLNGSHQYIVLRKATNVSLTAVDQIIASGHGEAQKYLNDAVAGDTIQISTSFAGIGDEKIYEMIGGWGHIVKKGINTAVSSIEEEGTMMHENDRHPRSAAAYNQDKTKLYLVAADGRSELSKGMNLKELANFMIDELRAWDGLNFDGGGSTTLMAGNQTVNNLSGGVQRAIANALLVVNESTTSAIEVSEKMHPTVFPNPAKNFITIQLREKGTDLLYFQIYHLDGRLNSTKILHCGQHNNTQYRIELEGLQSGTYLFRLSSKNNVVSSGKFMVD